MSRILALSPYQRFPNPQTTPHDTRFLFHLPPPSPAPPPPSTRTPKPNPVSVTHHPHPPDRPEFSNLISAYHASIPAAGGPPPPGPWCRTSRRCSPTPRALPDPRTQRGGRPRPPLDCRTQETPDTIPPQNTQPPNYKTPGFKFRWRFQ